MERAGNTFSTEGESGLRLRTGAHISRLGGGENRWMTTYGWSIVTLLRLIGAFTLNMYPRGINVALNN
jgi:hypothetical protein